jgi:trans-2,3-dihydro-3-hydroxyanthranilate isomerase
LNWIKSKAEKWLNDHKPRIRHYTFALKMLSSRDVMYRKNQLIDAPYRKCKQLFASFSLKYHSPVIEIINNQGEFINRPSQIFSKENYLMGISISKSVGKHNSLQRKWEIE